MKPAPFEYRAPTTVEEALDLLATHSYDAKILAGGQSLVPTMNFRLAQPAILIDLNKISSLSYIEPTPAGGVRIGAMTRYSAVEKSPLIAERAPLLHEALPHIAHPQIRTRGTMGGAIAHADPAAELPAVCVALDAKFKLQRGTQTRTVPAEDFFVGLFATVMEPDEMLVEIELPPLPPRSGWAFAEVARRHGDYALVGVAAGIVLDAAGNCADVRLSFLSVGDHAVLAHNAIAALKGQAPTADAIANAAAIAASDDISPGSDIHATAEYRRHLAKTLAQRTLTQAAERASVK